MDEKLVKDSQCLAKDLVNDCISRQAAIDALNEQIEQCDKALSSFDISMKDEYAVKVERASLVAYKEQLEFLPSAQPKRKTGKWIEMGTNKDGTHSIRCSKCGGGYKTRGHARSIATKAKYKFCPNCGADMRGKQDG